MNNIKKTLLLTIISSLLLLAVLACGDDDPAAGLFPIPDKIWFDYCADWSESNDLIAYIHVRDRDSNDPDSSGIYIIQPDGTDKRLLFKNGTIRCLDWAPDGTKLIANVDYRLMTISYPDGLVDTLTSQGEYFDPVWSPDGSMIASAWHTGDERGIYLMNEHGENYRKIISYGHLPSLPYQDSIIYVNYDLDLPRGAICMADTSGNFRRAIYTPADVSVRPRARMHTATGRLIFEAKLVNQYGYGIWKLEAGDSVAVLFQTMANYADFSPDGEKLIFSKVEGEYGRIWVINWDGTGAMQLTF